MVSKLEQMRVNSRRIGLTDKAKYEAGAMDMLDAVCGWLKDNGCFSYLQEGSQTIEDVETSFRKVMEDKI